MKALLKRMGRGLLRTTFVMTVVSLVYAAIFGMIALMRLALDGTVWPALVAILVVLLVVSYLIGQER